MNSYIAFLRGINVGGQKKVKMYDLKKSLVKYGFQGVKTYIQSGNVFLKHHSGKKSLIATELTGVIFDEFGFHVPVVVKTAEEIQKILEENPFCNDVEDKNLYFTLLHQLPDDGPLEKFRKLEFSNEDFEIKGDCVYLNCKMGAGKAKLNNNIIEKQLKVRATTRNLNTLRKMVVLANVS